MKPLKAIGLMLVGWGFVQMILGVSTMTGQPVLNVAIASAGAILVIKDMK